MPSGYRFSRAVRREFFDLVCQGVSVIEAERTVGVSFLAGSRWWREAGAMKLRVNSWGPGGLAHPGNLSAPGGRGHRLSLDERIAIMRGLDAKLSYAEIGRRIGRDRSVVWREHQRNRNPDGDYHTRMAHGRARMSQVPWNFGGGPVSIRLRSLRHCARRVRQVRRSGARELCGASVGAGDRSHGGTACRPRPSRRHTSAAPSARPASV